ncbi:MAG: hypothetical protein GX537_04830, partial [Actinobacteria bacterium]|nr:hypothetical protein [Actinomycetota bacterium]
MLGRALAWLLLAGGWIHVSGCGTAGGGPSQLTFSPDGSQVAFIWEDNLQELAVDGRTWLRHITLHWCRTNDAGALAMAPIGWFGAEYWRHGELPLDMKWSPGASRIGVLTPHTLVIVEAHSRRVTAITDEVITSFAWVSDTEVAYCTKRTAKGMHQRALRRYDLQDRTRGEIARFAWRPACEYTWNEHWSPSGQFVVFMEPPVRGRFHIVNIQRGVASARGQTDAYSIGVAWAPDSSRALCVSAQVGPALVYEAFVIDPLTGEMADCTSAFSDVFGDSVAALEPLWTADGRYVLVNAPGIGGHLVQPVPWEAIPLGRMFEDAYGSIVAAGSPWLFPIS